MVCRVMDCKSCEATDQSEVFLKDSKDEKQNASATNGKVCMSCSHCSEQGQVNEALGIACGMASRVLKLNWSSPRLPVRYPVMVAVAWGSMEFPAGTVESIAGL